MVMAHTRRRVRLLEWCGLRSRRTNYGLCMRNTKKVKVNLALYEHRQTVTLKSPSTVFVAHFFVDKDSKACDYTKFCVPRKLLCLKYLVLVNTGDQGLLINILHVARNASQTNSTSCEKIIA